MTGHSELHRNRQYALLMSALIAFVTASLTFVLLIFTLSLIIATAQERVITFIRAHLNEWGVREVI